MTYCNIDLHLSVMPPLCSYSKNERRESRSPRDPNSRAAAIRASVVIAPFLSSHASLPLLRPPPFFSPSLTSLLSLSRGIRPTTRENVELARGGPIATEDSREKMRLPLKYTHVSVASTISKFSSAIGLATLPSSTATT